MLPKHAGIHHVALRVTDITSMVQFYCQILGYTVEWQPDEDNYYLTSGHDSLAIHKADLPLGNKKNDSLDHIGIVVSEIEQVDLWYSHLVANHVPIYKEIKNHRDGSRSFYFYDPEQNIVQVLYHPPLSPQWRL
ncbi:MAG: VOC family protein [Methylacidiphilales bacterium]|nr:VOC family protein [Candidatus Methylacidiphilales bacterium]